MSDQAPAAVPLADSHAGPSAHKGGHATLSGYIGLAVFLGVVTGLEIGCLYVKADPTVLKMALYTFSIAKFAGVVAFFMHLYFDSKLFTFLFIAGLICAGGTMWGLLHAQPVSETPLSNEWEPKAPVVAGPKGDPKRGLLAVEKFKCTACHQMPGAKSQPETPLAPNQDGLADRAAAREPGHDAEAYIRESITEPGAFLVPGFDNIMPKLRPKMTDQEFEDIVAYLMSLHKK